MLMVRKPQRFFTHLICWISGFVFVYGITDLIVLEVLPDIAQILLVFTLAFISTYQEAKGNQKGKDIQRKYWMDWYNKQHQVGERESQYNQSPPMLEVY